MKLKPFNWTASSGKKNPRLLHSFEFIKLISIGDDCAKKYYDYFAADRLQLFLVMIDI